YLHRLSGAPPDTFLAFPEPARSIATPRPSCMVIQDTPCVAVCRLRKARRQGKVFRMTLRARAVRCRTNQRLLVLGSLTTRHLAIALDPSQIPLLQQTG